MCDFYKGYVANEKTWKKKLSFTHFKDYFWILIAI